MSDPKPKATPAPPTADKKRKAADEDSSAKKAKTTDASSDIKNVFVGGLSWNVDDDWLKSEFEKCGTVLQARVITDRESHKSKGCVTSLFKATYLGVDSNTSTPRLT